MIDDDLILLDEHDELSELDDDGINHESITPAVPNEPHEPNEPKAAPGKKPRKPRKTPQSVARDALMAAPKFPPCYGLLRALLSPSQRTLSTPDDIVRAAHGNMQVLLKGRRVKLGHKPKAAITIFLNKLYSWVMLQDDRTNHIELINDVLGELEPMVTILASMELPLDEQWGIVEELLDHWWCSQGVIKEHTELWAIVMRTARAIELQREEQTDEDTITP